jgi:hypothetical protein
MTDTIPRSQSLDQLTTELTDFMELPDVLGLPPVCAINLSRRHNTAWTAEAQLWHLTDDQEVWDAVGAWSAATGSPVVVSAKPHASHMRPSGMARTVQITVTVAHLSVRVWSTVDGLAPIPAQYAEAVTA